MSGGDDVPIIVGGSAGPGVSELLRNLYDGDLIGDHQTGISMPQRMRGDLLDTNLARELTDPPCGRGGEDRRSIVCSKDTRVVIFALPGITE